MQKIAEYQHTECSVKSVFKLPEFVLSDDPIILKSPICGLGWSFTLLVETIPVGTSYGLLRARVTVNPGQTDPRYGFLSVLYGVEGEDEEGQFQTRSLEMYIPSSLVFNKRGLNRAWWFVLFSPVAMKLPTPPVLASPKPPNHLIQALLTEAISNGGFNDTKFCVYSSRLSSGRVCHPRPLFANSSILKAQAAKESSNGESYFRALLFGPDFMESSTTTLQDDTVPATGPYTDMYDYDSDSDLEDDYDDSTVTEVDAPLGLAAAGRTIFVEDAAYTTWHALILYLYTGNVSFKSLRSEIAVRGSTSPESPPTPAPRNLRCQPGTVQCSPKSMYRLADKLGLPDLEFLAFEAIKASITEENVVQETFSSFTSRYHIIQELQIELLFDSLDNPQVSNDLQAIMGRVATGELPHSKDVVTAIMRRLLPSPLEIAI